MTVCSLVVTVAAGLAVSLASAAAPKSKNKLAITGPTAILFHRFFSETVSCYATGPANFVISGEQLNPVGGCASTFVAELRKPDFGLWGRSRNRPGELAACTGASRPLLASGPATTTSTESAPT